MLACSSKRALSSTRTATCLPSSAARMRAFTMGLSPEVRYRVCLMARTPRVGRGLLDEGLDGRGERVVRVVDEDLLLLHGREEVDRVTVGVDEARLGDPHPRLVRSCSAGDMPSGLAAPRPASSCSLTPATRTWKNSSRPSLKMARNLTVRAAPGSRPRPG